MPARIGVDVRVLQANSLQFSFHTTIGCQGVITTLSQTFGIRHLYVNYSCMHKYVHNSIAHVHSARIQASKRIHVFDSSHDWR